jgi:hypothetical protein
MCSTTREDLVSAPSSSTGAGAEQRSLAQAHAAASSACPHKPSCPAPQDADRLRAHVVAAHPEQGWSLLCNGVVVFDDLGALLPTARPVGAGL